MSIAAYGDPALQIRPASSFVGFLAALANLALPQGANWAEVEAEVVSGELDIERGIEAMTRILADSRATAERGEQVPWDYLIERLAFHEAEATRDLAQMRRLVDRISALSIRAAVASRTRARTGTTPG